MFSPSALPRNLEASFRDAISDRAPTRASAIRDVVRHALRSDPIRARAIPLLERLLREDGVAGVRAEAAVALADVRAGEVLPSLLVAVEDEDAHVRQMALSALGEIGDARAAPRLERALRDRRPEMRYQAVIAFARVAKDDPAAVATALAGALEDADDAIRYIAMRMAEEYGIDGRPLDDARLAARAEQLVETPDEAVAVVAALYLARLGRPCGRDIVLDVVAARRRCPELEDEQACVELTGELRLREAIPDLEHRVWGGGSWLRRGTARALQGVRSWGAGRDPSCAWHARIALARMDHARARAEIMADLGSWRRDTREAAVVAAGRGGVGEARPALERMGGDADDALVREALVRLAFH